MRDYSEPATYEWAESVYRDSRASTAPIDNSEGTLAWNESYALQSYLAMYRATADLRYLDRFAAYGYQLLAARDSQRGSRDYLGRTGPVWGTGAPYTVGSCVLFDDYGVPALEVCSLAAAVDANVTVRPRGDTAFDITMVAGLRGPSETITGLSTDPQSPAYLLPQMAARAPTPTGLTIFDLRDEPTGPAVLRPVAAHAMNHARYAYLVHTGMLAGPLAEFAALTRQYRDLIGRFAGVARDFSEAAQAALSFHDEDWRQIDERTGLYLTTRGAPIPMDGTYVPHNQYLAAARARAHLYRYTSDPTHAASALLMLNNFISDLSPGAAPVWPYYWSRSPGYLGYGPKEGLSKYSPRAAPNSSLEDTSHGALDVECLLAGYEAGVGISSDPLRRISETFVQRVALPASDGRIVSAESLQLESNRGSHDLAIPRWAGLARWNRGIFDRSLQLFNQLQPAPTQGQVLAAIALLVASR